MNKLRGLLNSGDLKEKDLKNLESLPDELKNIELDEVKSADKALEMIDEILE